MNFITAVRVCFKKYWVTEGRASRGEFWYFTLFTTVLSIVFIVLDHLVFATSLDSQSAGPLEAIFYLITFFPSLFVSVRRLHDTDRSFRWMFISITIVGLVPLFYWFARKGTLGENRFGPDPLEATHAARPATRV